MGELTTKDASGLRIKYGNSNELGKLKPFQRDIYLFYTHVAGTSHVEDIDRIVRGIKEEDRLEFFREPSNPYDDKAILIKTPKGEKIGYVPKKDNPVFARLMDAGKLLYGKVTSIEEKGKWYKIDIDIYLKD